MHDTVDDLDPVFLVKEWAFYRCDDSDGEIHYEAQGPNESYIRFEGPNAKADWELFSKAITAVFAA